MQLNVKEKVSGFISSSRRVMIIAKKPDMKEFRTMAQVTGIGIIIVAVIAYIIYLVFAYTPLG